MMIEECRAWWRKTSCDVFNFEKKIVLPIKKLSVAYIIIINTLAASIREAFFMILLALNLQQSGTLSLRTNMEASSPSERSSSKISRILITLQRRFVNQQIISSLHKIRFTHLKKNIASLYV